MACGSIYRRPADTNLADGTTVKWYSHGDRVANSKLVAEFYVLHPMKWQ